MSRQNSYDLDASWALSFTANNTAGIFGARTQPNNSGGERNSEWRS